MPILRRIFNCLHCAGLPRQLRAACLTVFLVIVSITYAADAQHSPLGRDVTLVVISDINESYGSTEYSSHVAAALDYIASLSPDLVICAGDMIAGQNKKLSESNLRAMWQAFDEKILQRLQAWQIPFAFTFGNHDGSSSANFVHERKIAEEFWGNCRPDLCYVDVESYPACYSFAFGGIFFAVIDASSARIDPAHKDWLEQQLASTIAKKSRLRVVVGHLPMYAIAEGRNRSGDVLSDADSLHALLDRNGADYYISGHHHAFYPSCKGRVKMISAGALGGGPRKLLGSEKPAVKTITTLYFPANGSEFKMLTHDVTNNMKLVKVADFPVELSGYSGNSQLYNPDSVSEK
ncbi:MAG: metallophosphoesterase [Candidatus Riflebacteria bacterium HGW-Riflebacteria-2]|jgi:predicted phosphodiesterase|nr:MAG: metallophosphoesterase [Candidatus Riflebacteria bacterium HGW-Riflebacteria-2]